MVTSTGSGLAVPDWPLSYGTWFPPMVGGVFYEHGHRMVAAGVGVLVLCLTLWLGLAEKRRWVRTLGLSALATVVIQGILGGMTVLFFLPTPLSLSHGILAQIFFVLTVLVAYSQSSERKEAEGRERVVYPRILQLSFLFMMLVYGQLVLGALMRHTDSGLAIPDFPRAGGYWIPPFHEDMLSRINAFRFGLHLGPVAMHHVVIHFVHRLGAIVLAAAILWLNGACLKIYKKDPRVMSTLYSLDLLVVAQLLLGVFTVLSRKSVVMTTFHVATGAAVLGASVLLLLRLAPLSFRETKRALLSG